MIKEYDCDIESFYTRPNDRNVNTIKLVLIELSYIQFVCSRYKQG